MSIFRTHDVLSENWHRAWCHWNPKSKLDLRRADKAFKAGYLAAMKDMEQTLEAISKENVEASASQSLPLTMVKT